MYPKMLSEIMEAIETHFDDEPDIAVDCMKYLSNALADEDGVHAVEQWFVDNGRCPNCGEKMKLSGYKEYHGECGDGVYEMLYEPYCPNCDRIGGN